MALSAPRKPVALERLEILLEKRDLRLDSALEARTFVNTEMSEPGQHLEPLGLSGVIEDRERRTNSD